MKILKLHTVIAKADVEEVDAVSMLNAMQELVQFLDNRSLFLIMRDA